MSVSSTRGGKSSTATATTRWCARAACGRALRRVGWPARVSSTSISIWALWGRGQTPPA